MHKPNRKRMKCWPQLGKIEKNMLYIQEIDILKQKLSYITHQSSSPRPRIPLWTFSGNLDLSRHLLTHTGVKAHTCNTCGKCFTLSSQLTTHMRSVHLCERYTCEHCSKSYTSKQHLTSPIKSVHLGERYTCEHCSKSYTSKQRLTSHIKAAHLCDWLHLIISLFTQIRNITFSGWSLW